DLSEVQVKLYEKNIHELVSATHALLDSLGQVHWVPDQEELAMLQACNCDLSQLSALRVITNEPLTVGPLSASVSETEIDLHSLAQTIRLPFDEPRIREIMLFAACGLEVHG